MSKSMSNVTKGIITGIVVGTTVGVVMNSISKPAWPFSGLIQKITEKKSQKNS